MEKRTATLLFIVTTATSETASLWLALSFPQLACLSQHSTPAGDLVARLAPSRSPGVDPVGLPELISVELCSPPPPSSPAAVLGEAARGRPW